MDKRKRETDTILPSLFKGKSMWLFWPNLKNASFLRHVFRVKFKLPSVSSKPNKTGASLGFPTPSAAYTPLPALACWTPSCSSKTPRPRHHTASPSKCFLSWWPLRIHTLLPSGLCAQKGLLDYRGLHSTAWISPGCCSSQRSHYLLPTFWFLPLEKDCKAGLLWHIL